MTTLRRFRFSCVALAICGMAFGLAGCGDSGGGAAGPQPEVKLTPPVNAKGESLGIENESAAPAK